MRGLTDKVIFAKFARETDKLGRIVIPKAVLKNLNYEFKQEIEFWVNDDTLILKKFDDRCIFCRSNEDIKKYKNKMICDKCFTELINI